MAHLSRSDLWSLEEYAQKRAEFRKTVIEHKQNRQLALGDHVRLLFEDEMTIRYQIQEMLRIEKVFEAEGIQDELDAYNPLLPDGSNWKCTMMIEFGDPVLRKQELAKMIGIEHTVWMQVEGFEPVKPIANEDLERSTDEKTSSVHFMRFELTAEMVKAAKAGARVLAGIDHSYYQIGPIEVPANVRELLVADLSTVN
ncbi:MAG: DUF3501 family protein [Saccharospirillum sp.]|nr:DUF3501 family protein [Saccharospirillum sp.]